MAKGKGKNTRHERSSNPQSGSSHGIEKRFRKENTQQASRNFPDLHSGPTVAPKYAFVPEYSNAPSFASGIARNANSSWPAAHGEEMVSMDQLSGYIFMCNGSTKADCFKYRVFGLPPARMDVLEKIKPQMKLFLYDFHLKLLHGIYVAASNGKLAIEPSAFGGKFSAQVRFDIFKDCLPLPESAFKHIIKDNYQGSRKFKQELNGKQVTNLISLFRPIAMSLPAQDEPPGFQVPRAWATKTHPMHLPRVGTQPPSEHIYPAEAHQSYRPQNPALTSQDPYSRYVALPRDTGVFSTNKVPAQPYVAGPSQFSRPLHGHAPLPPSTRTAAYWAAVASEGLKQADADTYQGMPSGRTGLGLPVTAAGAALTPPPVPENIDAELLQQLGSTVNDNHHNSAVVSASPIVQEPALVPSQFEAPLYGANGNLQPSSSSAAGYWTTVASEDPKYMEANGHLQPSSSSAAGYWKTVASEDPKYMDANGHLQPSSSSAAGYWKTVASEDPKYMDANGHLQPSSSSSTTAGYWTAVASEDPNLAYSVPHQWQWQPTTNTGAGAEIVPSGSAPLYSAVQGSANEFAPHLGTSNDYYTHNVNLATTNDPVQAHDQVTYYQSAPTYWTVAPSQYPNQLYSGYYQVPPPGSSVNEGDPNQLLSGSYQVLPPGSSGLGGEQILPAASVAGAATATND